VKPNSSHHVEDISKIVQKYNPTLKNILRVEQVLSENKEFESKAQLAKKLDITMRPPVLNVILRYLEESGKVLLDNDGSLVWIYASVKARKSWDKAVRL
jgi:ABC-type bacteriocin/lantibiotic exporter with double-glycine peptidase domain